MIVALKKERGAADLVGTWEMWAMDFIASISEC